jgi:hypothetical protein
MSDLAPLQRVMLLDSLAAQTAGHHVEQVEIIFAPGDWRARVPAAWEETVARTEVLQTAFLIESGGLGGVEWIRPIETLIQSDQVPESWDSWLFEDRHRPIIIPHQVPWRAIYWPRDGRWVWTFHHALLDGRSITAVLQSFIARLAGGKSIELKRSKWHPPTREAIDLAKRIFLEDFPPTPQFLYLTEDSRDDPAVRCLGREFRQEVGQLAARLEITTATILIWAWGQTLAKSSGRNSAIVEQVRSGPPQAARAGFVMHTLPVLIPRGSRNEMERCLKEFRIRLLALRNIEGVSPDDFSSGVFPAVNHAESSVVMIEHGTLQHLLDCGLMVESLRLHESKGESLMATAHILPDLRLEVEGQGRHGLLDAWIGELHELVNP